MQVWSLRPLFAEFLLDIYPVLFDGRKSPSCSSASQRPLGFVRAAGSSSHFLNHLSHLFSEPFEQRSRLPMGAVLANRAQ